MMCTTPLPSTQQSACSQSDTHADGTQGVPTARPSVLVRRTTRIGVPAPLSSSRSFTTAMTHQPSAATVGGPLGILPVPSRRTRTDCRTAAAVLRRGGQSWRPARRGAHATHKVQRAVSVMHRLGITIHARHRRAARSDPDHPVSGLLSCSKRVHSFCDLSTGLGTCGNQPRRLCLGRADCGPGPCAV